jgi:hypothetical protein
MAWKLDGTKLRFGKLERECIYGIIKKMATLSHDTQL